jgi:hypothetical protein
MKPTQGTEMTEAVFKKESQWNPSWKSWESNHLVTVCRMLSMHVLVLSFVKLVQELKSFVVSFGLLDPPPNEHQSMPRHAVYNIIIPKWNMFRKLPSCCCRDHKWESSSPRMHNDPDGTSNWRIAWSMSDRIWIQFDCIILFIVHC